jgi:hypothetical protein
MIGGPVVQRVSFGVPCGVNAQLYLYWQVNPHMGDEDVTSIIRELRGNRVDLWEGGVVMHSLIETASARSLIIPRYTMTWGHNEDRQLIGATTDFLGCDNRLAFNQEFVVHKMGSLHSDTHFIAEGMFHRPMSESRYFTNSQCAMGMDDGSRHSRYTARNRIRAHTPATQRSAGCFTPRCQGPNIQYRASSLAHQPHHVSPFSHRRDVIQQTMERVRARDAHTQGTSVRGTSFESRVGRWKH